MMMVCCNNNHHYRINCCEDVPYTVDHNGILYLTESATYQSLQLLRDTLRLKQYLTNSEMKEAFDSSIVIEELDTIIHFDSEIVPWSVLFANDIFTAEMVLLIDNTDTRGYYFQIRTYNKERSLISIQDFATWADKLKKYCSGDFTGNDMTFTVTCGSEIAQYWFDEKGNIISKR